MWADKAASWESFEAVREHRLGAWSTLLTYQNLRTLSESFLPCWKISPWPNQAERWDLQGWLSHKSSALIKNIMLFGERMFIVEEWIQHPSSDHVPSHVRPSTPLLLYRARKCSSHTAAFSWTSYPPEALKNKLLLIMNYTISDAITAPKQIRPYTELSSSLLLQLKKKAFYPYSILNSVSSILDQWYALWAWA